MVSIGREVKKRMKFYVGITDNRRIVFGPLVIIVMWEGGGAQREEKIIFAEDINNKGWNRNAVPAIEYLVAKKQYELKLKEEEVEIVLPGIYLPYSSAYKIRYKHYCKEITEARRIAEEKRVWLIRKVYADSYPEYELKDNNGLLTPRLAIKILENGLSPLLIEKRLSKIGDYLEKGIREFEEGAVFGEYSSLEPPSWWGLLFPKYTFCKTNYLMDGTKYPVFFKGWAANNGIKLTEISKKKLEKPKEKIKLAERNETIIKWQRHYLKKEPFLDSRQYYKRRRILPKKVKNE